MFVDRTTIQLSAGKGGNGIVSWRREKYIRKGGPYGGNGGRGGDIIIEADEGIYSLESYRHKRIVKAKNGMEGGTKLQQGKSGPALTLKVPFGTIVKDLDTGEILHDFTPDAPKWLACKGGVGGKGNATFKSSTNRAPNKCTPGKPGEELHIELELKLIADIGLVGMPNAGKSTLMSALTHAHVKIGAYPFTTLVPNLSYIQCEDYTRLLIADIPGIIEGASRNKGLGFAFLKHIERTSALLFVLDVTQDPTADFAVLRKELESYDPALIEKPFLVALNKIDEEDSKEEEFRKANPEIKPLLISAKEEKGLLPLIELSRHLCTKEENTRAHEHYAPTA